MTPFARSETCSGFEWCCFSCSVCGISFSNMLWLLSIASIWTTGSLFLSWLFKPVVASNQMQEDNILPTPEHRRVVALAWPLLSVWLALRVARRAYVLSHKEVVKTVVAFHHVIEWEKYDGKLLAPPKLITDHFDAEARKEVDAIAPEAS